MSTDRTSKVQTARAEAEQNADPRVDLAVERTELAHERTQLAWVRTVFSLYTAGIALDKGLEILHKERILAGNNWVSTGHFSGILLAILGTILSGLMTVIYFHRMQRLAVIKGAPSTWILPSGWLSAIATVLGVILSVLMITSD